jgi:hypothetical protein
MAVDPETVAEGTPSCGVRGYQNTFPVRGTVLPALGVVADGSYITIVEDHNPFLYLLP